METFRKKLTVGIICLISIGILIFLGEIKQGTKAPEKTVDTTQEEYSPPINSDPINVYDLTEIYHQNEVSADLKFKGKRLKIIGFIDQIRKDAFDTPVVELAVPDHPLMSTSCHFNKNDENILAQLQTGTQLTIVCTCSGMVIGSVSLNHCTIIK